MFKHIAVPSFIKGEKIRKLNGHFVQVVGDLKGRSREQSYMMFKNGFWPDCNNYLLLNKGNQTLAWLGFVRHGNTGVVIIKQIQGRQKDQNILPSWPEILIEILIDSLDRDLIHTVYVKPARTSTWFNGGDIARRGRLVTYYDRIPKRLGFDLADKKKIKLWLSLTPKERRSRRIYTPYHKLQLGL